MYSSPDIVTVKNSRGLMLVEDEACIRKMK